MASKPAAKRGRRSDPRSRPPSAAAPAAAAPLGLDARTLGGAAARFFVALGLLAGGLFVFREPVYDWVASLAAGAAALTSPAGFVSDVHHAPPDRFLIQSNAFVMRVEARSFSLPFTLVLPTALAFALPTPRRWWWTPACFVGCGALGALLLSQDLLSLLTRALEAEGVSVLPTWRVRIYETWRSLGWDVAMIAVPAALCMGLLAPWLPLGPEAEPAPPARSRARASGKRIRLFWLAIGAVLGGLGIAIGLGWIASARLADGEAQRALLQATAREDPDVPTYFLRNARRAEREGRTRDAKRHLQRALLFQESREAAHAGLLRLDS